VNPEQEDRLDRYLDRELAPDERAAFAEEVEKDAALRSDAELQSRIDASLVTAFAPPDPERLLARAIAAKEARRAPPEPSASRRWIVLAFVLGAALAGALWLRASMHATPDWTPTPGSGGQLRSFDVIYAERVARGFRPDWTCRDEREFTMGFIRRLGRRVVLGALPAGARSLGIAYENSLSERTTAVLFTVEERPVLVFVDELAADSRPAPPPASSGLHQFRQERAGLVLYEVSPLGEPHVAQFLEAP
jgi:hypothetical protein